MEFGSAHHRGSDFCQEPGKGDFGHGHPAFFRDLSDPVDDHLVLSGGITVFELSVAVLGQTLGSLSSVFGEAPACQSAVGSHGDILLLTERHHLPLLLTEDQVVVPLHGNEFCKAFFFCQCIGFGELPGKAVGDADIAGLSGFHHPVEPVQDVVEGRLIVPHMINVKIHMIHPEILKTLIDHALDMLLSGHACLDLFGRAGEEFCRHDYIVPPGKVFQCSSQVLLARPALVSNGSVKKVDAQVQPVLYDLAAVLFVQGPGMLSVRSISEAHASHADTGYVQVRIS